MRTRLLIILMFAGLLTPISNSFASCFENEDWLDAPCLDSIGNGRYDQEEINKWSQYYSYKGTEFMEQKRTELNNAINENTLQEWVDESIQNRNVYEYYFFSGRAPNTGEYRWQFDEFMINESSTIHDPYIDDERYQLALKKIPTGGWEVDPEFNMIVILVGILVGSGLTVGLLLFWRKRR
ncbi:MAG: hypothetical protein K5790_01755 [Nitrosopumilus sp.]|uniref:hypothetical protein n=1 Tax=Nitrosopumilus sp. TaxID=2024843 RepID=UPI00247D32E4|nr:hypothetical protein [Nitrosopumilus sp.]MCV0391999.1 hypothetical protein [Nitrosopumilus sp.]